MLRQIHFPLGIVFIMTLLSCALSARLYNLETGLVLPARFYYSGGGTGRAEIRLPDGEICIGEYVTIVGGSTSWGNIFGSVYSPTGSASGLAHSFSGNIDNLQKGTAIGTGSNGTIIECEYLTSAWSPTDGYGACHDNRGNKYKLMF